MTRDLEWHGCYGETWKGLIVDEAFSHPAKFSRALIRRIYEHAFAEGWLKPGDWVVDPFGGVALGALQAMRRRLHWVGCELEPRFVELGNENIQLWEKAYGSHFPNWETANLIQGDSRELVNVLAQAGFSAMVSSPPYADGCAHTGGDDPHPEHLQGGDYYGVGIEMVVSSPPYVSAVGSDDPDRRGGLLRDPKRRDMTLTATYGKSEGQMGNASGDDFWLAARQVIEQLYQVLAPSGVAIWVCKDFVRGGARVPFSDQWEQLCRAVGFVTVCRHRAMLVEHNGTALTLFGEAIENTKAHKSFFRRLAEQNGSPPIDWEDVICMRRV